MKMTRGPVVSCIVTFVAVICVVLSFANGGSPYVTMRQAKRMAGADQLHLAGDLIKDSISPDILHQTLRFKLKDSDGDIVSVVFQGETPQNMSEATKVVAVGHAEGNVFLSNKLLVKCPSKYEAEPKAGAPAYASPGQPVATN